MVRIVQRALIPLVLAIPSAADAAPGDGIAKSCVAATEARARLHRQVPPGYPHRKALCACLQRRVQADGRIADAQKVRIAKYFALEATDRKKALDYLLTLPKTVLKRMEMHGPACAKTVIREKPKN